MPPKLSRPPPPPPPQSYTPRAGPPPEPPRTQLGNPRPPPTHPLHSYASGAGPPGKPSRTNVATPTPRPIPSDSRADRGFRGCTPLPERVATFAHGSEPARSRAAAARKLWSKGARGGVDWAGWRRGVRVHAAELTRRVGRRGGARGVAT